MNLANVVSYQLGYGSSGEAVYQDPHDEVLLWSMWKVGLGPNALQRLVELGQEQLEGTDEFLAALSSG